MPTATINVQASIAGLSVQSSIVRTGTGSIAQEVSVPAAKAGTLSTRTGDDAGVVTLSDGHGLQTGDVVDVYWATGVHYGMSATIATNDATLDGGSGDNLPSQGAAVTVCKQVPIDCDFDGDKLEAIIVNSTKRGHAIFEDSVDVALLAQELAANEPWFWAADMGIALPITGNPVDQIQLSNGDSSAASTVKIALVYNSDA
jgi:hypothetical protein